MGRAPCCSKVGLQKGPWSAHEDKLLTAYIQANGEGKWRSLPKNAGLLRCGKSCRLRWMNYLRPGIKRGNINKDEEDLIIRLQSTLGNRWSLIAGRLPGRTDNEIKNHWNTHLLKRLKNEGVEPQKSVKILTKKNSKNPKKKKSEHVNNSTASSREDDRAPDNEEPMQVCSGFSATNSFGSVASGSSGNSSTNQEEEEEHEVDKLQQEEDKDKTSQVSDIFWSSFEQLVDQSYDREMATCDKNQILFDDDFDLSLKGVAPASDNLLNKVYDEYLQLL